MSQSFFVLFLTHPGICIIIEYPVAHRLALFVGADDFQYTVLVPAGPVAVQAVFFIRLLFHHSCSVQEFLHQTCTQVFFIFSSLEQGAGGVIMGINSLNPTLSIGISCFQISVTVPSFPIAIWFAFGIARKRFFGTIDLYSPFTFSQRVHFRRTFILFNTPGHISICIYLNII